MNQVLRYISIRQMAILCIGVFTLSLALGNLSTGHWLLALIEISLAGLWLTSIQRGMYKTTTVFFLLSFWLAVLGYLSEIPRLLALLAILASLAAWDLLHFFARMENRGEDPILVRQHLQRLGVILGTGFAVTVLISLVHIELRMGTELLIGLILIISLGQVVRLLQPRPKKKPQDKQA